MTYEPFTHEERHAYEKIPVPFCIFLSEKDEFNPIVVSDGFCKVFDVKRAYFNAPFKDIIKQHIHPDDIKKFRRDIENAYFNFAGQYEAVYRVKGGGSEYRWLSGKGRIERQVNGYYLLYVYFSDVNDETELQREADSEKHRQNVLLSDILFTTKTAIFWKDMDRRFRGANKAFLDYYGFKDESEIIGKNDEDMGWHTDPDKYKNDELRVLRDGVNTHRIRGKCIAKGENRDIVASKSPLVIDGKIVGLVGSFEDVTNEAKQQDEISRLNHELKKQISDRDMLMSISEVCIIKIDLNDFTITEYNDAMCSMIGCTREEYEKRYHGKMEAFFEGDYRGELDSLKKAAFDAINAGEYRFSLKMKMPTADGMAWVGGSASFTDIDPETKKPGSMYAVYRDITDLIEARKTKEQAEAEIQKAASLKEMSEKMRSMIDGVPSGLGALRITEGAPKEKMQINRYFNDRIDIAVDENSIVDLDAFLLCVHPGDRERCREDFDIFMTKKALMTRQYRFRRKAGDYVWMTVRGTVVQISEDVEIAYFIYTNVNEMKIAEAKLAESQRFYREVVRAAKLSTWEYDIPGHTIYMSDDSYTEEKRDIVNLPKVIRNVPDSLVGMISEEDREAFLDMYREVEAGRDASCEAWYKPVNGREPRCERVTYIITDSSGGEPTRAIGFIQNITADRKVEERYQREIGYMRQIDENNLVAKGHYNLTRNKVLEYTTKNDSFFKIKHGIPYDEALKALVAMPYQEEERAEIADKLDREKLIDRYQHGQMQSRLSYRRFCEGRLPIWISMNIHTYMMPETGDLEAFTYAYDVSGKMEIDEIMGLISDEAFDYIGLIYAEADEIELIKKSSKIENFEVRKHISYSASCDYIRRNFVDGEEAARYEDAVSIKSIVEGLDSNGGRHAITYHRTENGRSLCKQLDCVWMNEQMKIILVVRTDVTATFEHDQEQLARIEAAKLRAEKANEAKSTFLSSMSHDLRTPLNGVIGFTGLAMKEPDPEKKQEYLKKIDLSGKLLLDLVNDTLELSRIESGKAVLEPEAVIPGDLIPAVVTALRPSAELKGIHMEEDFECCGSSPVWCDKLKVQKIALNLISNAIKYTPDGGAVSVSMLPAPSDAPGCQWSLCVEDTGIGMSEDFMTKMFEPFSQEKRSESVKTPGTGLGLSIVKRYVDMMGGRIEVNSKLHEGTRWVVSLPICEVDVGTIRKEKSEAAAKSIEGKRVLLCEDNQMNVEIAVMLLEDRGVSVETAENGKIGAEMFADSAEGYYDAVLMDLRMPVMDGNTAAKKIRDLVRSDAWKVPIIAMTADAFEESMKEAKKAGMNGYVTKPVEPEKLFNTLSRAIYDA